MAIALASLSPSSGFAIGYTQDSTRAVRGGQVVTITGTGMAAVSSVLIEGRAAHIVSKTATEVVVRMPYRRTNGEIIWSPGSVDVVVSDGTTSATLANGYTYKATRLQMSVEAIEARAAAASTAAGYVWDYSPKQIIPVKVAPGSEAAGQAWPHIQVYTITANEDRESRTADGLTWAVDGTLLIYMPLSSMENIEHEQDLMMQDAIRILMSDTGNAGTSNYLWVTGWDKGSIDGGPAAGALGAVFVNFSYKLRHIENDPTSVIQWSSTQP